MAVQVSEARLKLTAEDATARGMASAARNADAAAKQMQASANRTAQAQARMAQTGERVAAGFVGAFGIGAAARAAKDGFVAFAKFDERLARIGITADVGRDRMVKVGEQLKDMANRFALPVDTMADGLDNLVASGQSLDQAMAFLPSVAATAQASGAAIGDIASSATALGTSMGFTSGQMQKAFDILAAGGKAGNFELKDMARYLPALAPLAASMGYKGEEGLGKLVAILQVVRKQTGDAGQAADATREIFSKMGSEELNNTFSNMGADLKGNMEEARKSGRDLPSFFVGFTRSVLEAAAKTRGLKDSLQILPELFHDVQMQQGMRALLSQPGAVRDLANNLKAVDGTVMKDLAVMTDGAQASAQRLDNSIGGVGKSIGKLLTAIHVPQGLEWLAEKLNEAAKGADVLSSMGWNGSVQRGNAIRSYNSGAEKHSELEAKRDAATDPIERAKLQEQMEASTREMDRRRQEVFDKGTAEDKKSLLGDNLMLPPDLPARLPDELLTPGNRPGDKGSLYGGFDGLKVENPRGAQEQTLKNIERGINSQGGMFKQFFSPSNFGGPGGMGGLIHKASYGSATTDAAAGIGSDGSSGGSAGGSRGRAEAPNWGAGGGMGGTAGARNLRYGSGSTPRKTVGGGSTPAEDGGAADVPGTMNPRLAGSRKALMDELDRDPGLKRDVIKTASMENRGSPAKMQAVIESMVNRAKMNGYGSLRQAIHSGFYGPVNRGGLSGALSGKDQADGEEALKRVKAGSNAIGYRTDQGMLTDPGARRYMQEPDKSGHQVIGGENFFYMGSKGRAWAKQQQALDEQRAKEAGPGAIATPQAGVKAGDGKPTGADMAESAGPIHPDTITKLSPYADQKKKPKRWVQDLETQKWKPDFENDGSIAGAAPQKGAGKPDLSGIDVSGAKAKHDELRAHLEKPIDITTRMAGVERLRDRGQQQARREIDRQVRTSGQLTYSDVGIG